MKLTPYLLGKSTPILAKASKRLARHEFRAVWTLLDGGSDSIRTVEHGLHAVIRFDEVGVGKGCRELDDLFPECVGRNDGRPGVSQAQQ